MKVSFKFDSSSGFETTDKNRAVYISCSLVEGEKRYSPTELLLISMGSCTSDDVLSILKKMRQEVRSYSCEVDGLKKDDPPRVLKYANVTYRFYGNINPDNARKAIHLSLKKYCSVSIMLERGGVNVSYSMFINDDPYEERKNVEEISEAEGI